VQIKIHTYTSPESGLSVNAFLVETEKGIVLIDTTLLKSDSKNVKKKIAETGKPLSAILITHGHPDHIAGLTYIADTNTPVYSLKSIYDLMKKTEEAKHKQWSPVFGAEWITEWMYPNRFVEDKQQIIIDGLKFTIHDLGSGGDSDANSIWLLDADVKAAFVGDFVYHNNFTYMADGSILRWISNLEKFKPLLKEYPRLYMGHGTDADFSIIDMQKNYLLDYCTSVISITGGLSVIHDDIEEKITQAMQTKFPSYGLSFMPGISVKTVIGELEDILK
jgi:glyoxylase-like metal-dependent hydrolase (beta-lactamase superfamily II)